jgi:predicted transcriptional regulator
VVSQQDLAAVTAHIVASYVERNSLSQHELPGLIHTVHQTIAGLGGEAAAPVAEPQKPAVSVRRSITPDYLICLEDGRSFKSLKRHLSSKYGLTPEGYRAKWDLPSDYPMVAPNYAKVRSDMAKKIGLGSQRKAAAPAKAKGRAKKA